MASSVPDLPDPGPATGRPSSSNKGGSPTTPAPPQQPYVSLFSPEDTQAESPIPNDTYVHVKSHKLKSPLRHRGSRTPHPREAVSPSADYLQAEKEIDDPTISIKRPTLPHRHNASTPTAVNSLFVAPASPSNSRSTSFNRQYQYQRSLPSETPSLSEHLYNRGLLAGRHSDINILAFGCTYPLHRIILDRAPFFASALTEPWSEASAKDVTLHPEDIDANITKNTFELALKRLYGREDPNEEESEAIGLFATGCWLEMSDLIETSVGYLLRRMHPRSLAPVVELVTANYYGRAGERILTSAKAMLSRDGWEMPIRCWDDLPSHIIKEVVSSDGFFVEGEWERWDLAKRLLDRRLKMVAAEIGLLDSGLVKAPHRLRTAAPRPKPSDLLHTDLSEDSQCLALYAHPDIVPLLELIDYGIYYVHLEFEQLQYIRQAEDSFGVPLVPEKIVSEALWRSMELRQKILNVKSDTESLDLIHQLQGAPISPNLGSDVFSSPKIKSTCDPIEPEQDLERDGTTPYDSPQCFEIPTIDRNTIVGGDGDTISVRAHERYSSITDPVNCKPGVRHFPTPTRQPRNTRTVATSPHRPVSFSYFPPFRFAAEFPNPRFFAERRRVYSRTVFYAGSFWNMYIQKVKSTSKHPQLGVYLHRAEDYESDETTWSVPKASVDERIGALERGILRSNPIYQNPSHNSSPSPYHTYTPDPDPGESSGNGGDQDATLVSTATIHGQPAEGLSTFMTSHKRLQTRKTGHDANISDDEASSSDESPATCRIRRAFRPQASHEDNKSYRPALPPYVDVRPTIKTYFKIYSPSKGGRMLSVYESAPDNFNFKQSWGWKSSSLMVDESYVPSCRSGSTRDREQPATPTMEAGLDVLGTLNMEDDKEADGREKFASRSRDSKLRFMVVLGVV